MPDKERIKFKCPFPGCKNEFERDVAPGDQVVCPRCGNFLENGL